MGAGSESVEGKKTKTKLESIHLDQAFLATCRVDATDVKHGSSQM